MEDAMPNVTISINDKLLKQARGYAKDHNSSLNNLIRNMLGKTVNHGSGNNFDECFKIMDKLKINSKGKKWKREELYDI